jgi:hypothetical protein
MPSYCTIQGREMEAAERTISNRVCFDTPKPIIPAEEWAKDLLASRQADLIGRAVDLWSLFALATSAGKSVVTA